MLVPKATSHLNGLPVPRQDNVRLPGEVFPVKSEAKAEGMDETPHDHFGLGVFALDERHLGAPGRICHAPFESASTWPG